MAYYVTGTVDRCPQFREINFPLLRDKPSILLSLDLPFSLSLPLSLYPHRNAATIRKILIDNGIVAYQFARIRFCRDELGFETRLRTTTNL